MPSLICSSRYTLDSQILRKTAQNLGWETLRLDGDQLPSWFQPPDDQIAFFYTAPHIFDLANQLGRKMVGCPPDWTVNLPPELLRRELRQMTLAEALRLPGKNFVKHALSKAFPAAVYEAKELAAATAKIPPASLVHVGEPVRWTHEFRCFVVDRRVQAVSPYVYDRMIAADYESFPNVPAAELQFVREFAESILQRPDVLSPPAFVLDVGLIAERGWAVVECNECWAAGIYACDPEQVLQTLVQGNAEAGKVSGTSWDFAEHYARACASV